MPIATLTSPLTEQICELLRLTQDGESLDPYDLHVVQEAVNDNLNDYGKQVFANLYAKVVSGQYTKPWLFGIQHLTIDHTGRVYWKGTELEHFTYLEGRTEHLKATAQRLAATCRHLEQIGIPVTESRAIWHSSWFETMQADNPFKNLLSLLPSLYNHPDRGALLAFTKPASGDPDLENHLLVSVKNGQVTHLHITMERYEILYHYLTQDGYTTADCWQKQHTGTAFANLAGIEAWLNRNHITPEIGMAICQLVEKNTHAKN